MAAATVTILDMAVTMAAVGVRRLDWDWRSAVPSATITTITITDITITMATTMATTMAAIITIIAAI
jgi:hypothetical protein